MKRITVYVCTPGDRPHLRLEWVDPASGKRKGKSAGTSDEREAELLRADLEADLNAGRHRSAEACTWERFKKRFFEEHVAGLREQTREKYGFVFDVWESVVGTPLLSAVTASTVSEFVAGYRKRPSCRAPAEALQTVSPWTIRGGLAVMSVAFKWGHAVGLLAAVPVFPKVKAPKLRPAPVEEADFDKLLAACDSPPWRVMLKTCWMAGLRLSEAWRMRRGKSDRWPWLDAPGRRVVLPARFAKADEDQWGPLPEALVPELLALAPGPDGEVFDVPQKTRDGVSAAARRLAKKAGVPLCMHKLRKGFGCAAAQMLGKGAAPVLHRLMRHANMTVTMSYYANVDPVLHEAMERVHKKENAPAGIPTSGP